MRRPADIFRIKTTIRLPEENPSILKKGSLYIRKINSSAYNMVRKISKLKINKTWWQR
jgi:hypothetical protein